MADIYLDWNSFGVGFIIGSVCVYLVCDLVLPLRK